MSIHVSCPISLETQGGCSPGRRVTDGRALKAVLPLEAVPQGAGTVPVRLLLSSVMLVMAGKDPPLPHESGRVPRSKLASRCSSLRLAHAAEPPEDHLHLPHQLQCSMRICPDVLFFWGA